MIEQEVTNLFPVIFSMNLSKIVKIELSHLTPTEKVFLYLFCLKKLKKKQFKKTILNFYK